MNLSKVVGSIFGIPEADTVPGYPISMVFEADSLQALENQIKDYEARHSCEHSQHTSFVPGSSGTKLRVFFRKV